MRFDNGLVLRLYRQTIEDFGLYVGLELAQEKMEQLQKAAGEMSAKMRAVRIVAASAVSKKELEHRLVSKGENASQAQAAVQWMSDMNLLDDKKVAEQIVDRCIRKGYGLSRVKQALYEKRIPKAYWDAALEDYPDQFDVILDYLGNTLDADADDRAKRRAIDSLIRKGHAYSVIKRAMEQLSYNTEDMPEA